MTKRKILLVCLALAIAAVSVGATYGIMNALRRDGGGTLTNEGNKIEAGEFELGFYHISGGVEIDLSKQTAPVFTVENFYPDDALTETFSVKNLGESPAGIRVRLLPVEDRKGPYADADTLPLFEKLNFTVGGASAVRQADGSVLAVFADKLSPKQNLQFTVTLALSGEETGNEYQGAFCVFDIRLEAVSEASAL